MPEEQAPASQPTPGRDVFISYASHDRAVADSVCTALESAGIVCWIAPRDVIPGESFAGAIVHAIDATKVTVLVLSEHAVTSQHVLREIERASSKRHPVIAFRIDLAPMPADFEYFLNTSQWLDASTGGVKRALPRLVDAVKITLAQPTADVRVDHGPAVTARAKRRSRRMLAGLAVIVAAALSYYIADKFWFAKHAPAAQPMTAATNVVSDKSMAASVKSLAVLPFENLSALAGDADLADGLHEEILSALARLRDLKVISRTSVMEFRGKTHNVREIGQKLGVGSILEGSIRRDRGVLRLTVQLVDARTDRHLFAANYDRDPTHVLDLQSAVARQVADALAATLDSYERGELDRVATNSGDAYDRYLRALAKFARPAPNDEYGLVEPIRLLEEALRFDPDYVDALALLSQAHTSLYLELWPSRGSRQGAAGLRSGACDRSALAGGPAGAGLVCTVGIDGPGSGADGPRGRGAVAAEFRNGSPGARLCAAPARPGRGIAPAFRACLGPRSVELRLRQRFFRYAGWPPTVPGSSSSRPSYGRGDSPMTTGRISGAGYWRDTCSTALNPCARLCATTATAPTRGSVGKLKPSSHCGKGVTSTRYSW